MVVRIAIENDTQRTVLGVSAFFATLATVSVGLRFWARKIKENPVKADDWCILVALVSCWSWGTIDFNTDVARFWRWDWYHVT